MRRRRFRPLHLAGWLFADMLLVLALVALGDRGDPQAAKAVPSPGPSPSATATETGKPRPKGPRSVSREPVTLTVDADYGDPAGLEKKLRAATKRYAGRQAAIVLTFGRHPDPGGGQAYARRVNSTLAKARPDMFEKTTRRDFWKGGAAGHASVEIYFYTY
ncbi:hypothetical protein [Streptomyces koyangensis]|uniref:Uncharacterized protein n=1 Tax=Streptomyces koyangensis TaxID=188770 RepID=A0ABX7EHS0_9ACTN|nr:hypothetical protein [Streptomyces koyangensis]QRF04193.1 hypothetical protein G9U55_19780 [Streptomyces koyangensis]